VLALRAAVTPPIPGLSLILSVHGGRWEQGSRRSATLIEGWLVLRYMFFDFVGAELGYAVETIRLSHDFHQGSEQFDADVHGPFVGVTLQF